MDEMRIALLTALIGAVLASGQVARAQDSKPGQREVEAKIVQAMESFDLLEFEVARRHLNDAIELARKNRLDRERILARIYLDLGIVEFAGLKNRDAAREAFAAAVAIDPSIEIDVAYRTDAMADLLAAVKKERGIVPPPPTGTEPCSSVRGLQHTPVDLARRGQDQPIAARVGASLTVDKVSLFYRRAGTDAYTERTMQLVAGCSYEAVIPAEVMQGDAIQYYVAARRRGRTVDGKGDATSPNLIELAGRPDGESAVAPAALARAQPRGRKRIFVSLAVGTGGGYVSGTTEVVGTDVNCCFAPALFHLFPEVGYYFSPRLSLSGAFRMGFALGANVPGHASAAPAGLLRLRYALSERGTGLQLSAVAGGGIIRHTVKVEEAMSGADTDTTASGPFVLGGGLGYLFGLSGAMQLLAELNGLAAFPAGVEEVGPCPGSGCVRPHFGFQVDVNLGILFAF
jgi:hypothetical protein